MVKVKNFRELFAWQKAMDLVVLIYKVTRPFPREEAYGLTSQAPFPKAPTAVANHCSYPLSTKKLPTKL